MSCMLQAREGAPNTFTGRPALEDLRNCVAEGLERCGGSAGLIRNVLAERSDAIGIDAGTEDCDSESRGEREEQPREYQSAARYRRRGDGAYSHRLLPHNRIDALPNATPVQSLRYR